MPKRLLSRVQEAEWNTCPAWLPPDVFWQMDQPLRRFVTGHGGTTKEAMELLEIIRQYAPDAYWHVVHALRQPVE